MLAFGNLRGKCLAAVKTQVELNLLVLFLAETTLLEILALGKSKGAVITSGVKVGYYRQDFSTLNFEDTVFDSLMSVMDKKVEEHMRSVAAGFLITAHQVSSKIGSLSEGQKGLVAFARLVLQEPGLLILDEPTNHINFRHIPVIAAALDKFAGGMILVSPVPEFVKKIKINKNLDLEKLKSYHSFHVELDHHKTLYSKFRPGINNNY